MTTEPFDPARYLTRVSGSDYLEVKWRLVWLRDRHPDALISTQLHELTDQKAVFSADIRIPGGGEASGWGSETPGDFRDYLEKAETKAIGRALAALGFGTQFCPDHDFGGQQGRVVDAPVRSQPSATGQPRPQGNAQQAQQQRPHNSSGPSVRQMNYIRGLAKDAGLVGPDGHTDEAALLAQVNARFGKQRLEDLTGGRDGEASRFIELLERKDLTDGVPVNMPRLDAQEANQQGIPGMPEEPDHIRHAPSAHFQ